MVAIVLTKCASPFSCQCAKHSEKVCCLKREIYYVFDFLLDSGDKYIYAKSWGPHLVYVFHFNTVRIYSEASFVRFLWQNCSVFIFLCKDDKRRN